MWKDYSGVLTEERGLYGTDPTIVHFLLHTHIWVDLLLCVDSKLLWVHTSNKIRKGCKERLVRRTSTYREILYLKPLNTHTTFLISFLSLVYLCHFFVTYVSFTSGVDTRCFYVMNNWLLLNFRNITFRVVRLCKCFVIVFNFLYILRSIKTLSFWSKRKCCCF